MSFKKIISILVISSVVFCSLPFVASAADALSYLTYEKDPNNNYIVITGCNPEVKGVFDIPSVIDSLPVKVIDYDAFMDCEDLTEVNIPQNIVYVYESSFSGCSSLTAVNVSNDNVYYSSTDGVLFDKSKTTLYFCPEAKTGIYTIPESVRIIGDYAFENCSELTDIVLHNNIQRIGYGAFDYTQLYNDINNWEEDGNVFYLDNYLIYAIVSGDYTVKDGTVLLADFAFSYNEDLTSITIPDSVRFIGNCEFYCCYALTDVTIADNVEIIGYSVMYGTAYYNDESNWDNGVLYLGKYLLDSDQDTVSGSYTVKDGTVCISDDAFYDCYNLSNISIPDSVVYIGEYAFSECDNLVSIEIPNSVKYIGYAAFYYCLSLSSVDVGYGVDFIGDYAFYDCDLKDVTLPYGIDTIGYAAFGYVNVNDMDDKLIDGFLIKCYQNSTGMQYAIDSGIEYEIIETESFELVDNENCYIDNDEDLLFVLKDCITVADMLSKIGGGNIKVFVGDNQLNDSDLIKTGCTIRLMEGNVTIDKLTIVVMGDVDCNGKVTVEDARMALRDAVDLEEISDPYGVRAAKADGSGDITPDDARFILRVAVNLETYQVPV